MSASIHGVLTPVLRLSFVWAEGYGFKSEEFMACIRESLTPEVVAFALGQARDRKAALEIRCTGGF